MTVKLVKELERGDRVSLENDAVGMITKVEPYPIIETKRLGGAWLVEYRDEAKDENGSMIVGGMNTVEVVDSAPLAVHHAEECEYKLGLGDCNCAPTFSKKAG